MKKISTLAVILVCIAARPALAQSAAAAAAAATSLTVTARVKAVCTFDTNPTIDLGEIDPSNAVARSGAVDFKYWCTNGMTAPQVAARSGASRRMNKAVSGSAAPEALPYTLTLGATAAGQGFESHKSNLVRFSAAIAANDIPGLAAGQYEETVTLDWTY